MVEHNAKSLYDRAISHGYLDKSITYKEFSTITRAFNKRISDEILGGYVFRSPINKFEIRRRERKLRAINWKESFDEREAIRARGEVPYDKENAPNGIKWFRYYTHNMEYVWKWTKHAAMGYWKFSASRENKKKIGRLVNKKVGDGTIKEMNYEFL